jgi:hypothetical protein
MGAKVAHNPTYVYTIMGRLIGTYIQWWFGLLKFVFKDGKQCEFFCSCQEKKFSALAKHAIDNKNQTNFRVVRG